MLSGEDLKDFNSDLSNLSVCYKQLYEGLRKLKGENVTKSLIEKGEEYLKNMDARTARLKSAYVSFADEIGASCSKLINNINFIEKEDNDEVEGIKNDFERINNEIMNKIDVLSKNEEMNKSKEPIFIYRENKKSMIDVEMVKDYKGSYFYKEYMSGKRTADGDIYIDIDGKNDELIMKYMNKDKSLEEEIKKMNNDKRSKLIDDLSYLELPIKGEIIKQIGCNEDNEIMEAWRNRCIMVNGIKYDQFNALLKEYGCFDSHFNNACLNNIRYNKQERYIFVDMKLKYLEFIEDYLKNGKWFSEELINKYYDYFDFNVFINEMKMIGMNLSQEEQDKIEDAFYHPIFFSDHSKVIDNKEDDKKLQKLVGYYDWKLIYKASEHGFKREEFHKYCDDKGPTLVVVKSSGGWIFGGYTTQSWSGRGIYDDMI